MQPSRQLLWSGVAFAALLVGAGATVGIFEFMPPAGAVLGFFDTSHLRVVTGSYLGLLAAAALIWFAGALYREMQTADRDSGLPAAALGGGVMAAVLIALAFVAAVAGAERSLVRGDLTPGGATTLFDLWSVAIGNGAPVGVGVMVGSVAMAGRGLSIAHWLRRASGVLAIALFTPYGWAAIGLVVIWTPVVALGLARRRVPDGADASPGPVRS